MYHCIEIRARQVGLEELGFSAKVPSKAVSPADSEGFDWNNGAPSWPQ